MTAIGSPDHRRYRGRNVESWDFWRAPSGRSRSRRSSGFVRGAALCRTCRGHHARGVGARASDRTQGALRGSRGQPRWLGAVVPDSEVLEHQRGDRTCDGRRHRGGLPGHLRRGCRDHPPADPHRRVGRDRRNGAAGCPNRRHSRPGPVQRHHDRVVPCHRGRVHGEGRRARASSPSTRIQCRKTSQACSSSPGRRSPT